MIDAVFFCLLLGRDVVVADQECILGVIKRHGVDADPDVLVVGFADFHLLSQDRFFLA